MKNKFNIFLFIGAALLIAALPGCDMEPEVSDPISPDDYPVASFSTDFAGGEISEGDTIVYTITIDKQMDVYIPFDARIIGGTATNDDFEVFGGRVEPYTNETKLYIVAKKDYAADDGATATLEIGAFSVGKRYVLNEKTQNPTLNVTMINYVADYLEMTFAWEKEINIVSNGIYNPDYPTDAYSTYDMVDIDIFISDAEGFDPADPFATFNDFTFAATGDAPEVLDFPLEIGEGSYVFFAELWYNDYAFVDDIKNVIDLNPSDTIVGDTVQYTVEHEDMPITVTVSRQGVFGPVTLTQDEEFFFNSATPGADNESYDGEVIDVPVCKVTIENGEFIVEQYDGTEVVRGKIEDFIVRSKRPDNLRK